MIDVNQMPVDAGDLIAVARRQRDEALNVAGTWEAAFYGEARKATGLKTENETLRGAVRALEVKLAELLKPAEPEVPAPAASE